MGGVDALQHERMEQTVKITNSLYVGRSGNGACDKKVPSLHTCQFYMVRMLSVVHGENDRLTRLSAMTFYLYTYMCDGWLLDGMVAWQAHCSHLDFGRHDSHTGIMPSQVLSIHVHVRYLFLSY
jgi:hypothetical protein